jgi:hypothetical protein
MGGYLAALGGGQTRHPSRHYIALIASGTE